MPKAFFAHAGEDKPLVEAVLEKVVSYEPEIAPWLDKYEILAGQSLIERIAAGMDDSDKFVIFLSPASIKKPWVKRELRRAIMREIDGVDPDFIIPVVIGDIDAVPAFLEDKKYIALHKMTEAAWLTELVAAIQGRRRDVQNGGTENLIVRLAPPMAGKSHIARVIWEVRYWAVEVCFAVETTEDIVHAEVEWPTGVGAMLDVREARGDRIYGFRCRDPQIRPGHPVVFVLEFAPDVAAPTAIKAVGPWNNAHA